MKNQPSIYINNNETYKFNYRRNYYGFRGEDMEPSEIKAIIMGGSVVDERYKPDQFTITGYLNKNLVEGYFNLGNLYKFLNKTDKAIKCYKKSIQINPKLIIGHISLANIYISLGEINKAVLKLRETINIDGKAAEAHRLLSRITKYNTNSPHLKEMQTLYKKIEYDNEEDKMILDFALGKAFEDIKNYDLSFKHYNEANIINKNKRGAKSRRNEQILVRRSDFLRLSLSGTPSLVRS